MGTLAPRKVTANRLNAAKSTGPRTRAGKAAARYNALAHGLRALAPVLPGEDPAEWARFSAAVLDELAPAGPIEGELAARVAGLQWRLRRAMLCEVAAAATRRPPTRTTRPASAAPTRRSCRRSGGGLAAIERELARGRRSRVLLAGLAAAGATG